MATYIERINGYIADNPNLDFQRDGESEVYSFYEVSTANMSANNNMLTITGGQSNYPLAYIETDRTLEFTFASAEFTLDMFGMANATPIKKKDTSTLESKLYRVETGLIITIPYQTKEGSIRIKGFTEATGTTEAGKFTVEYGDDTDHETVITFHTGDCAVGDTMRVAYRRRVNGASVATNSITFAAIDPKDADAQMYSLTYEPLDGQGQVITTPSDSTAEW